MPRRVWLACCVWLLACGGGGGGGGNDFFACPSGDVDCFFDHLVVTESGVELELVTVDLDTVVPSRPPTMFAAAGGDTRIFGFDGASWSSLAIERVPDDPELPIVALSTSPDGVTWALDDRLLRWNAGRRTFEPVACDLSSVFARTLFARNGEVLIGGAAGSYPAVVRFDGNTCTGGTIDTVLTGSIQSLWSDGTNIWAIDRYGTWRFTAGSWARFTPGDTPPCCWSGVWASSASDVWLYGGTLRHWTGAAFQPDVATDMVSAMAGSGPSDVWAGSTELKRWNGSNWGTGTPVNVLALWAGTPEDAWRVTLGGSVEHWNGLTWTSTPIAWSGTAPTYRISGVHSDEPPPMQPTALVSPTTMVLAPGETDALTIDWTDPYGARPAFCFSACSRSGRCVAASRCTRGIPDGLRSGQTVYRVGYTAVAAPETTETFNFGGTPIVRPDGTDPIAALTAGTGSDVIKGLPFEVTQMVESEPEEPGGGGTCTGGGLRASRRACVDLGSRCECTNEPTDTCIAASEFTSEGYPVPTAATPQGGTGCIVHLPSGSAFLVRPCAAGLSCKAGPICGGADEGTCLP